MDFHSIESMKILHINAVLDIGSTGTITRDIHELCISKGISSKIVYAIGPERDTDLYRMGNIIDHKLHALLSRFSENQASFSNIPTRNLIKEIEKYHPDWVHFHNVHANFIHVYKVLDYLSNKGIGVVITLHDCWFFTGGCTHFTSFKCDRWKINCGECPRMNSFGERPSIFDGTARNRKNKFDALSKLQNLYLVGVSNWVVNQSKLFGLTNAKYATIYNGIDFEIFKPTESDLRKQLNIDGKFILLGPSDKWKSAHNIENLKLLASKIDEDCVIVLFGGREKDSTLPDNIIEYSYTRDKQQLAQLYSMSDVFINSTHEDTLSLINIEAQACGTPVITYRNTGAQETVDEVSSISVPDDDIDVLLFKIKEMKQNTKSSYSKECINWVRSRFDINENYQKYIELYKSRVK